jgi:hypothetical protein
MKTIKLIFKTIDRFIPFKETGITLLFTFTLLIIIEYIWDGSIARFFNMNHVIVAAIILAYLAAAALFIRYIRRSIRINRFRQKSMLRLRTRMRDSANQYGQNTPAKTLLRIIPPLLLILPIILLLLIAIETIWKGSVSYHINFNHLIFSTIITEIVAILAIIVILERQNRHKPIAKPLKSTRKATKAARITKPAIALRTRRTGIASRKSRKNQHKPTVKLLISARKATKAVRTTKTAPALHARQTVSDYKKPDGITKITRRLSALLSNIFLFLLAVYLLLFLAETIWEESVSSVLNLNYLLIAVIAFGIPAVLTARKKGYKQVQKHIGVSDILIVICAGAAGAVIVWYKTKDIGWPSVIMSIISCALIVILSLLILKDGDEG